MVSFTAELPNLLSAVRRATKAADTKSGVPILGHVHLTADLGGCVTVTGTDFDVVASASCRADISTAGSICLPADSLRRSLELSAGAEISLSSTDRLADMRIGSSKYRMEALPATDFPSLAISLSEPSHSFKVDPTFFADLRKRVGYAIDPKEHRFFLVGINLAERDGLLVATSASFSGLSQVSMLLPDGAKGMPSVIIPASALDELSRIEGKELRVDLSETFIRAVSEVTISSKLVDGSFPDVRRLIPSDNRNEVRVATADLLSAVSRVGIYAPVARMGFRNGSVHLSGERGSGGDVLTVINAGSALQMDLGLAVRWLLPCLKSFDSKEVIFRVGDDPMSPVLVIDPEDEDRSVVLMPYALSAASMQMAA